MSSSLRRQAVSAALWLSALYVAMAGVIGAAIATGHHVTFDLVATLKAVAISAAFGLLALIGAKHAPRPARISASFLLLWIGGVAGGIICMVGAMFGAPYVDPWLAAADRTLGLSAADVVRMVAATPFAPRLLYTMYFLSVILLFLTGIALALLGRTERLWEFCASYCFCLLGATVCSIFVPAIGAFDYLGLGAAYSAHFPPGAGVYYLGALQTAHGASSVVINPFGLQGIVTFPSFHTSMALMTAAAWRGDRYLHWPMMIWNALIVLSAVPIGGHYLVDLVGGAALWVAIFRYGPAWADAFIRLHRQMRSASKRRTELAMKAGAFLEGREA